MVWIRWLRCEKFRRDFVAWTFALIAPIRPVLHQYSSSNETVPNAPKHYEAPKHEFRVQLCRSGVIIVKHSDSTSLHELLQYAPIRPALHRVSSSNETVPNALKHYETHQNMSLASNGVDQVHSLRKITTQLHCTNFCINCTSSTRFAPSFV